MSNLFLFLLFLGVSVLAGVRDFRHGMFEVWLLLPCLVGLVAYSFFYGVVWLDWAVVTAVFSLLFLSGALFFSGFLSLGDIVLALEWILVFSALGFNPWLTLATVIVSSWIYVLLWKFFSSRDEVYLVPGLATGFILAAVIL